MNEHTITIKQSYINNLKALLASLEKGEKTPLIIKRINALKNRIAVREADK